MNDRQESARGVGEAAAEPEKFRFLGSVLRLATVVLLGAVVAWTFLSDSGGRIYDSQLIYAALAAQLPMFLAIVFATYRHALLVRTPRAPFWITFRAMNVSAGLNVVVPGRLSELVKLTYLRHYIEIPYSRSLAAVMVERLSDLIIVGSIGLLALVANLLTVDPLIIGFVLGAALALLLLLPRLEHLAGVIAEKIDWSAARFAARVLEHSSRASHGCRFLAALAFGVLSWTGNFLSVWIFMSVQPLGNVSLPQTMALFSAITFAGAIPGLPGGIGAYEGAATLVLMSFGFTAPEALAIAISLHLSQLALSVMFTSVFVFFYRTGTSTTLKDATRMLQQMKSESET